MTVVNLITGAFIILLGILIKHGNMHYLIAGYNTASSEKKKKFDIQGFSTLLRNCFILIGLIIIVGNFIFQWLEMFLFSELIIGISVVLILPYLLVRGQKFDHSNSSEKVRKNQKIILFIYGVFLALLIAFFIYGSQNTKVEFKDSKLEISGLYGVELPYSSIDKVELLSEIPKIKLKTNGFSLGCVKKGNFKLDEIGNCKLYLNTLEAPFIKVVNNGSWITYINFVDSKETEKVFQELVERTKN